QERISIVTDMIKSFGTSGLEITMTTFNKAGRINTDKSLRTSSEEKDI
ncbi:MAG: hypothetical protein QG576_426, partial [Bacteroidota bacterium]|nr:hypothetical protein [Bacteroidota bacterium]